MLETQRGATTGKRSTPVVNPLAMRVAQAAFGGLGELAPDVMSRLAYKLYFTPRRFRRPETEAAYLRKAERFSVSTSVGEVAAYAWTPQGAYPWDSRATVRNVLLVHGWEGRGTQLGAFIEPLRARGCRVVAFDAPAHGHSEGERSNVLQFVEAIHAVTRMVGPLSGVVAHSMGGASLTLAMAEGLPVDRAVLVASPCYLDNVMRNFVRMLHLTPETERRLRRMVEADFGADVWQRLSVPSLAHALQTPALIIHDEDDGEVAFSEGLAVHQSWSGSRLHVTRGLGHRRVLKDGLVIDEVVGFLMGERDGA
ncbi:MAG: alpha/beta hydrolase [Myxococcota bacterium]